MGVSTTWGSQKRDEEEWGILLLLPPQTVVKSQVSFLLSCPARDICTPASSEEEGITITAHFVSATDIG